MLKSHQVKKYQAIYKKLYGKDISSEQAHAQGQRLMHLIETIIKPSSPQK